MNTLYRNLHNEINEYLKLHAQAGEISLHIPMVGNRYSEQPVRIMWIGRAVNGWQSGLFSQPLDTYLDSISQLSQRRDRFSWLNDRKAYNYMRSPFWRNCKLLHQQLHNLPFPAEDWYEDIVWTNLYWVAPAKCGNPCTSLCAAQKDTCYQLLAKQIKLLNPTHIVFVTDWDWFSDFCLVTDSSDCTFTDIQRISADDRVVVATGTIGKSKAVITKRPERRIADKDFTTAVLNAFNTL